MFLKMVKTTNQDIVYIYIWTMMNFKHIPPKKGPFLFVGPRQAKRFLVRPGDRLAFCISVRDLREREDHHPKPK